MNAFHCIHVLLSPQAIMTCGWTLKNWGGSAEKENSNAKTHPEPENGNLVRIACAQSDCRAYSSLLPAPGKPLSIPQIWLTSTSASAAYKSHGPETPTLYSRGPAWQITCKCYKYITGWSRGMFTVLQTHSGKKKNPARPLGAVLRVIHPEWGTLSCENIPNNSFCFH